MTIEDTESPQDPELTPQSRELTQQELEKIRREESDYWAQLSNLYSA